MFFDGFESLQRTGLIGLCAYVVLVFFLRISGRRTLSKMNAFDFIVTIALGSTLATVLLSKDVSLADGALAFGLLIGLQYLVTWSSVRFSWVKEVVTGEPVMLVYRGGILRKALLRARVTEDEIRAAVRGAGLSDIENVESVVLETDGSFNVVTKPEGTVTGSALRGVQAPGLDMPADDREHRV